MRLDFTSSDCCCLSDLFSGRKGDARLSVINMQHHELFLFFSKKKGRKWGAFARCGSCGPRNSSDRKRLHQAFPLSSTSFHSTRVSGISLFFLLDVPYRRVSQRQEVLTGVHQVTTGSVDTRGSTSNTLRPEFKSAGILPAGISS